MQGRTDGLVFDISILNKYSSKLIVLHTSDIIIPSQLQNIFNLLL